MTTDVDLLTIAEAADKLGIAKSTFRVHVLPHVSVVRVGRTIRVPATEIKTWVDRNATRD